MRFNLFHCFSVKNECDICGIDCRLKTELVLHKLSEHKLGCKEAKISQIINSCIAEDFIYSSDSECEYKISFNIERVSKRNKLHSPGQGEVKAQPIKNEDPVEFFIIDSNIKEEIEEEYLDESNWYEGNEENLSTEIDEKQNTSSKEESELSEISIEYEDIVQNAEEIRIRKRYKRYKKRDPNSQADLTKTATCCICFKEFSRRGTLRLHISTIHNIPYNDTHKIVPRKGPIVIPKNMQLDESLLTQIKRHADEMAKCAFCYKAYATRDYLRSHLQSKHGLNVNDAWMIAPRKGKHETVSFIPDISFECYSCKASFFEMRQLQSHFKKAHMHDNKRLVRKKNKTGKAGKYQCPICKQFYVKNYTRRFHMLTIHKLEQTKVIELTKEKRVNTADVMELVDSDDSLVNELKPKTQDSSNLLLECYICKKSYSRLYTLRVHMDQLHRSKNDASRYYSGKRIKPREDEYHTREKKIMHCNHCNRDFTKGVLYEAHINFLKNGKRFFCRVCCTGFDELIMLREHKRLSEKCKAKPRDKSFLCYECGKGFTSKGALEFHFRSHTNEKPFECQYCDARFKSKNALEIHNAKHTNYYPYKCKFENCDRAFPNHGALAQHKRMHLPPEFKCNVCAQMFHKKGALR